MLAQREDRHPDTWPLRARGVLAGFAAGIIPAVIMLAVLVEARPSAVSLQSEAIAYFLYFISLPIAAFLFRYRVRSATVGFAVGVIVTTGLVIVNVFVAAAHAVAGGAY
jgi:hypothetical protein